MRVAFYEGGIVETLGRRIAEHRLDPALFMVEITEAATELLRRALTPS